VCGVLCECMGVYGCVSGVCGYECVCMGMLMRPFLKWAGNKYRVLSLIKAQLPEGTRLIEPFMGSGALFLNTQYPRYLLGEINQDLVNLYKQLKQDDDDFIKRARPYFSPKYNAEKRFYHLRDTFNDSDDPNLKSALFLYLNKFGYNGLCRYNSDGGYNVPFGSYKKPYFPEKEMRYFHKKSKSATFRCMDFIKTMNQAKAGDVVYCDPPYVPLSNSANFTQYHFYGFDEQKQILLADKAKELRQKGVFVMISNHNTPFTKKLYKDAKCIRFSVQRTISCQGQSRNKAPEVLAIYEPS